jgi:hypothetical protein
MRDQGTTPARHLDRNALATLLRPSHHQIQGGGKGDVADAQARSRFGDALLKHTDQHFG